MKTSTLWFVATALLASVSGRGAPFEGRVQFERTEELGGSHTIICAIKGDKSRIEVIRDRINSFITDSAKKETTVILEDDMAYIRLPSLASLPDFPKPEKTNETTKILGYEARKYLVPSEDGDTEVWVTEDFGVFTGFGEGCERPPANIANVDVPEAPPPPAWEYALAGQHLFPLRVITRDGAGREVFRLEAKIITAQPLDDRLFIPSRNYKKLDNWPESQV